MQELLQRKRLYYFSTSPTRYSVLLKIRTLKHVTAHASRIITLGHTLRQCKYIVFIKVLRKTRSRIPTTVGIRQSRDLLKTVNNSFEILITDTLLGRGPPEPTPENTQPRAEITGADRPTSTHYTDRIEQEYHSSREGSSLPPMPRNTIKKIL